MKRKNKLQLIIAIGLLSLTFFTSVYANNTTNDARKLFLDNNAIIYEINMRTFNANDINGNGIIDFDLGEVSGNFTNAIERLDEMQAMGINMLHVLPITQTGKTKALGTAGSLYAAASFNKINEQLNDKNSTLTLTDQAKKFVEEAHKRGIRIILDIPACGAYDLYLQRPELFVKDKEQIPVIPADWTDVRLLNAGNETTINDDVFNVYKEFVDMAIDELGVDGIRADVAHCKPAKFWKELISYSRKKDPQFLWLAESSDSWHDAISTYGVFTSYDKLLDAGFDGYYGSFFNLKTWHTAEELINHIQFNQSLAKTFTTPKSVIGSFTTHDELSPVLINGIPYSSMIIWLNATLPINSYFVDGFATGDDYVYDWANQKAETSFTDDDYYFAHRGKIDIFNFSRKPGKDNQELLQEFTAANKFKKSIAPIITHGKFTPLKTNFESVFAYAMSYNNNTVLVYGNLDFDNPATDINIKIPGLTKDVINIPAKARIQPELSNGRITVDLNPGEINVFLLEDFELK